MTGMGNTCNPNTVQHLKSGYYKQLCRRHSPPLPTLPSSLMHGLPLSPAVGSSGAAACTAPQQEDPTLAAFPSADPHFERLSNPGAESAPGIALAMWLRAMPAVNLAGNVCSFLNKREVTNIPSRQGAVEPCPVAVPAARCLEQASLHGGQMAAAHLSVLLFRGGTPAFPPFTSAFQIAILHPLLCFQLAACSQTLG